MVIFGRGGRGGSTRGATSSSGRGGSGSRGSRGGSRGGRGDTRGSRGRGGCHDQEEAFGAGTGAHSSTLKPGNSFSSPANVYVTKPGTFAGDRSASLASKPTATPSGFKVTSSKTTDVPAPLSGKHEKTVPKQNATKDDVPRANAARAKATKPIAAKVAQPLLTAPLTSTRQFVRNPESGAEGRPLTVLMVGEKPSIARAVAEALSAGRPMEKRSGVCPVWEFSGPAFLSHGSCNYRVTSTTGHVFTTDFHDRYNNWNAVDATELFDAEIVKKNADDRGNMPRHLATEARGCDAIVLWLDCDREGENICFETIDCCAQNLNRRPPILTAASAAEPVPGVPPNIFRVRFSSLVASDLRKAFREKLTYPNIYESQSVDARQELDLKVGVSFTRFISVYFNNRFANLNSKLISYGPCQCPTLWFIVDQQRKHETFQPENFYTLHCELGSKAGAGSGSGGESIMVNWRGGKIADEKLANAIARCLDGSQGLGAAGMKVVSVRERKQMVRRPLPLNTVALMKKASTVLGMSPQRALQIAESLYLRGFLTYPRTESTHFAPAFNLDGAIDCVKQSGTAASLAKSFLELCNDARWKPAARKGHDAGDHPPITPCGAPSNLDADEAQIFRLVAQSFLQSIAPDAAYTTRKYAFKLNLNLSTQPTHSHTHTNTKSLSLPSWQESQEFWAETRELSFAGFMALAGGARAAVSDEDDLLDSYYYEDDSGDLGGGGGDGIGGGEGSRGDGDYEDYERDLLLEGPQRFPQLKEGDEIPVKKIHVVTRQTTRPKLLTESSLLSQMEYWGIGTDASMSTHIANIISRNYVVVSGATRTLSPTPLGKSLLLGLEAVDPELTRPVVRSLIENSCSLIATGRASKDAVLAHTIQEFKIKFQNLLRNISKIDGLFELQFTTIANTANPFSRCGRCRLFMNFISKEPLRLVCQKCSVILKCPPRASIKSINAQRCPFDDYEILLAIERNGRGFLFCPMCYNHSPFAGMTFMRCIDCPQSGVPNSRPDSFIAPCFSDECVDATKDAEATHLQMGSSQINGKPLNGILYIQNFPGTKKGLVCSECPFVMGFEDVELKSITKDLPEKVCDQCGWRLVKAKLRNNDTVVGCLGCEPRLTTLIATEQNKNILKHRTKRRRGPARKFVDPKMTDKF